MRRIQIKRAETLLDWGLLPHLGKHPENEKKKPNSLVRLHEIIRIKTWLDCARR